MSITSSLTSAQFKQAAELKEKIEALNQELTALLAGEASAPAAAPVAAVKAKVGRPRKKSKFSAEGLARLRAGQAARWARVHAEKAAKAEKADQPVKKTRKMSKAARAKIAAGARARWARVRAEKAGL
jgi:hypothetical protein